MEVAKQSWKDSNFDNIFSPFYLIFFLWRVTIESWNTICMDITKKRHWVNPSNYGTFRFGAVLTHLDADKFRFWDIQISTDSDFDIFTFWPIQILTHSDSDPFKFWHIQILMLSCSDALKLWHFHILTQSYSDTFILLHSTSRC